MQPQRTYPVLSRVCIAVGIGFLLLSAIGNWRFGWSLAPELIDRLWLSTVYSGSDVAAGVMVAAGATMLWREGFWSKIGGLLALIPALILVSLSILSTFGMMSGRIGVQVAHQAGIRVDQDRLSWLRSQTVNREVPKGDRRLMRLEERQAAQEARKAAQEVTDPQAVAIANALAMIGKKLTVEQTQVALTLITSTMPMTIKFVLIWLGFLLYGARKTQEGSDKKTHQGSGGPGSGSEDKKLNDNVKPFTKPEPAKIKAEAPHKVSRARGAAPSRKLSAFDRTFEAALANPHLSTRALAAIADCSQSLAQKVRERQRSKVDSILRKHGNGGGYRPAYN